MLIGEVYSCRGAVTFGQSGFSSFHLFPFFFLFLAKAKTHCLLASVLVCVQGWYQSSHPAFSKKTESIPHSVEEFLTKDSQALNFWLLSADEQVWSWSGKHTQHVNNLLYTVHTQQTDQRRAAL